MSTLESFVKVTAAGKMLSYENPTPDMIDLRTNAHELSLIQRWGGNLQFPYSVAQHSILVADTIQNPAWRIYGLLHDAAEPYTGDMPTPFKGWLTLSNADVYGVERRILAAFWDKLNIPHPTKDIAAAVHAADARVLSTEYRDVVLGKSRDWEPPARPLSQIIKFKQWDVVLDKFVNRLDTYTDTARMVA